MDPSSLDHLAPSQLARLLDLENSATWPTADLAAILDHQLAAPLLPDLATIPGNEPNRLTLLITNRPGAESFLRQLAHIHPSLELLEAIKRFARHHRDDPASPLHHTAGTLLYYAAIAAALLRCNTRITQLTTPQLAAGFTWALHQPIPTLHLLFTAALNQLPTDP